MSGKVTREHSKETVVYKLGSRHNGAHAWNLPDIPQSDLILFSIPSERKLHISSASCGRIPFELRHISFYPAFGILCIFFLKFISCNYFIL